MLFSDDAEVPSDSDDGASAFGFYWTEGLRGLGWAVEAVPTLKGGSTIGIPSPPAVWLVDDGFVGTPDIRDAERLQGFAAGWTSRAGAGQARGIGARWKLVGNAVSVPVAEWLGRRLAAPAACRAPEEEIAADARWPTAAYGDARGIRRVDVSPWPVAGDRTPLQAFLEYPLAPLSKRATAGFLSRARRGSLRFRPGFLEDVERHLERMGANDPKWNLETANSGSMS